MTRDPRLVRSLLRLYPSGWRERYGEELAGVLVSTMAGGGRRWRTVLDVAAGAVDAHLDRTAQGGPVPDRILHTAQTSFFAFVAFVVAGSGFAKMTEDLAFQDAARAHPAVGWSFDVVYVGAIAAGLIVLAGCLPVLIAIARQALGGRGDLLRLLLVPPLAVVAWLGMTAGVTRLLGTSRPMGNHAIFVAVIVVGILAAGLGAGALAAAARRADLPDRISRAEWLPMTGLGIAMVAVSAGGLVWGLALRADAPALYHSDNGIVATALPVTWLVTVGVMVAASAFAVAAAIRAIGLARATPAPPSASAAASASASDRT